MHSWDRHVYYWVMSVYEEEKGVIERSKGWESRVLPSRCFFCKLSSSLMVNWQYKESLYLLSVALPRTTITSAKCKHSLSLTLSFDLSAKIRNMNATQETSEWEKNVPLLLLRTQLCTFIHDCGCGFELCREREREREREIRWAEIPFMPSVNVAISRWNYIQAPSPPLFR